MPRPTRIPGAGANTRQSMTGVPPELSRGGRPADFGLPTVHEFCTAAKKDGERCGARPVKGTALCVGHSRSLHALGQDGN